MSNNHYFKDVSHLDKIDVYRVLKLFNVTDQNIGHAVKKLLCPGQRSGGKSFEQDLIDARDSINRALEMIEEDRVPDKNHDAIERSVFEDMRTWQRQYNQQGLGTGQKPW